VFAIGLLSTCAEYGLETWPANKELDTQLICNQNSLRTWVRPAEGVRLLTLGVQTTSSVYELDKGPTLCMIY